MARQARGLYKQHAQHDAHFIPPPAAGGGGGGAPTGIHGAAALSRQQLRGLEALLSAGVCHRQVPVGVLWWLEWLYDNGYGWEVMLELSVRFLESSFSDLLWAVQVPLLYNR